MKPPLKDTLSKQQLHICDYDTITIYIEKEDLPLSRFEVMII